MTSQLAIYLQNMDKYVPFCNEYMRTYHIIAIATVLEINDGHWPFSDQFQHLTDQNPFWSAKFPVHFQWDTYKICYIQKNSQPISDPYF